MKAKFVASILVMFFITSQPSIGINSFFFKTKKGDYATFVKSDSFVWASKFKIVEIGASDTEAPQKIIAELKKKGVRPVFYDWAPAGYYHKEEDINNTFIRWVYKNRTSVSLNPNGPFPMCAAENGTCKDYYFDFGNEKVVFKKADFINRFAQENGYGGVFFDWASGTFINEPEYKEMKGNFSKRHPKSSYIRSIGNFYRLMKDKNITIITNQGFRNAENVLPFTDYDMTESYGTGTAYTGKTLYVKGIGRTEVPQTVYFPVSEDYRKGSLKDTIYYLNYLRDLREKYKNGSLKNFIYMNYAAPIFVPCGNDTFRATEPKNAIFYNYALAKLCNFVCYTEVPFDHALERDNVYFYDLGKPLGKSYQKINGGYVRYYENGFVVLGNWQKKTKIVLHSQNIKSYSPLYDLFEKKWIRPSGYFSASITISPEKDELTGKFAPAGRVFLYPFFKTPFSGK